MKCKKFMASLTAVVLTICATGSLTAFPEDQDAEKLRIMPLGDSITDGFTGDPVGGYRLTLWKMLEANGYTDQIDFVGPNWGGDGIDPNHAGYSGYAIADIPDQRSGIYNFVDWLMESYPADVVMLQIGTNDILSSYELDAMPERLELLVDTILEYLPEDGLLYLATIPYMDADVTNYTDAYTAEEMDQVVDDYNTAVKALISEKQAEGKPIALSDINSQLTKQDLLDGVHPNATGYEKMGNYWYQKITEYLNGDSEQPTETTPETVPETTESITETVPETIPETTESTESVPETTEPIMETIPEPTESVTETTESGTFEKGDILMDHVVNLQDLIYMQKYLVDLESITEEQMHAGDMDSNNLINIYDFVLL
ncbi:MAG: hypothetical protein K2H82_01285, partial [Oscillospiraceae bacterium]|nr:hypothetical protein [Oscillospiraceae bacterium]